MKIEYLPIASRDALPPRLGYTDPIFFLHVFTDALLGGMTLPLTTSLSPLA
jgi:hypothetical protein